MCRAGYRRQLRPVGRDELVICHLIPQLAGCRTRLRVELATKDSHALVIHKQGGSAVSFQSVKAHEPLIACFAEGIQNHKTFCMLKRRREFADVLHQGYEAPEYLSIFLA